MKTISPKASLVTNSLLPADQEPTHWRSKAPKPTCRLEAHPIWFPTFFRYSETIGVVCEKTTWVLASLSIACSLSINETSSHLEVITKDRLEQLGPQLMADLTIIIDKSSNRLERIKAQLMARLDDHLQQTTH